jgi:YggT family protein
VAGNVAAFRALSREAAGFAGHKPANFPPRPAFRKAGPLFAFGYTCRRPRAAPRAGASIDYFRKISMNALASLIDTVFTIYIILLLASVISSWLVQFNVLNTQNQFIYSLLGFLYRITEPALRPLRRLIPPLGGIDLSPMILIIALYFIRDLIVDNLR